MSNVTSQDQDSSEFFNLLSRARTTFSELSEAFELKNALDNVDIIGKRAEAQVDEVLSYQCKTFSEFEEKLSFLFKYVLEECDSKRTLHMCKASFIEDIQCLKQSSKTP